MNIYFKGYWKNQSSKQNKIHQAIADTDCHLEAIMLAQLMSEEERINLTSPILTVINGNKGVQQTNEAA